MRRLHAGTGDRRQAPPPLLAALAALVALAPGCVGPPVAPYVFGGDACPGVDLARVEATVEGAPGALVEIRLVETTALRAQSCQPPLPPLPVLAPTGDATAEGEVAARAYEEVRVRTTEGIVRLAAEIPASANGTLRLDLGADPPTAAWNGTPLDVRGHERFDDPRALDPFVARWADETTEETVRRVTFSVNSSWNRGARAEATLSFAGEDRALAEEPARAAGARVELRLLDEAGHVIAWRNATRLLETVTLATDPLAPGTYALEMRATPADERAFPVGHAVLVDFAY